MKKFYFLLFLTGVSVLFNAQAQVTDPDAFYTFDEAEGTQITDSSDNGFHAFWYNYNGEDPGTAENTGWRPEEGYRGGAGYFAGDHVYCGNPCSSGSDLLIFSKSNDEGSDVCMTGEMPENNIFTSGFSDMTLSFWFKNDWNYLCDVNDPPRLCFEDTTDCAFERQVLWTAGSASTGVTLEITPGALYPALVKVTINGGVEGEEKFINAFHEPVQDMEWVHFAVVFDGDSAAGTGELFLYTDTILQGSVETDFGYIPEDETSVVFGGENGASVTGSNVTDCWGSVFDLCGITAEQVGRVRYGWPARGWIDELAYWRNAALTKEEITAFAKIGSTTPTGISPIVYKSQFQVYPTVTDGQITFDKIGSEKFYTARIFNCVGMKVMKLNNVHQGMAAQLPSNLSKGIYFVELTDKNKLIGINKIILK